ncbi:MAG: hypothetical protein QG657_2928 [Acidobacteriota bacterium]|nr:hypothetical protein [Acidobacteriota bacterium]
MTTRTSVITVLGTILLLLVTQPAPANGAGRFPEISFQKESAVFHRQKLSITKPDNEINSSDLRPFLTISDEPFVYTYRFTFNTPLADVPLQLSYRDGNEESVPGFGWQLTYLFPINDSPGEFENPGPMEIDLFSFFLTPFKNDDGWFFLVENDIIPLEWMKEEDKTILSTKRSFGGMIYRFLLIDCGEQLNSLLYRIEAETPGRLPSTQFIYEYINDAYRLHHIQQGEYSLLFQYSANENPVLLKQMILISPAGGVQEYIWDFHHQTAALPPIETPCQFLARITANKPGQEIQQINFSYRLSEPAGGRNKDKKNRIDWYSETANESSAWEPLENGNWILPDRMNIRNYPGLRFMDLNKDSKLDLVDTEYRRMKSWLWDKTAPGNWREYSTRYLPSLPTVKYSGPTRPTGSQYNGLVKKFKIPNYNTIGYQSIITSYYKPSADGKRLEYFSFVDFPRVLNGKLNPDANGNCWVRDEHPLLKLPAPLQYEGESSWPTHLPGIAGVERGSNQGSQFVDLTCDGNINLFYIGLRYRDAATGEVLLSNEGEAPFRDTRNCVQWYETEWSALGKTRRVIVDVCQACWKTREKFWAEWYPQAHPGKNFWQRLDLDKNNKPNGTFTLPWNSNSNYLYHYVGFRNIQFCKLHKIGSNYVFAVVQGRACPNCTPPVPEAKDIYLLERGTFTWKKLDQKSGYYPPADFFDSFEGEFIDLNGDGLDDAVVAVGNNRKAYINTGNPGRRWKKCPAFIPPRDCDLKNGGCQLLNLTKSKTMELFLESGKRIYVNKVNPEAPGYPFYMTTFTDENGLQRQVEEIQ